MIINSLLDTDLYKYTMMQAVLHKFPEAMVEYNFKCRTPGVDLTPYAAEISAQIDHYCSLKFLLDDLQYLAEFKFFKRDFIEFLRIFTPYRDFVTIVTEPEFNIIIKGPWLHTIVFEVPILAIINEIYFRHQQVLPTVEIGTKLLNEKISLVAAEGDNSRFKFAEFGTRRRFSLAWHKTVLQLLLKKLPQHLTATSNLYFAREFGLKAMGTMAHEYIQACQALDVRLLYSQKFAFETWAQEYRGDLGIALSDTYGTKAFLKDFDLFFSKLFDGARHDSGDPFTWAKLLIAHYKHFGIDPRTKTLVFTDSLTMSKALEIYRNFHEEVNLSFGIGTHLTNDCGHAPIDIVIKMVECNGQPVAKISESPGKTICKDANYLAYLKEVFGLND